MKFLQELAASKEHCNSAALFLAQSLHLSKSQSIFLDLQFCVKLCLCLTLLAIPFFASFLFLEQNESILPFNRMELLSTFIFFSS
jgi:hypothetical protein